MMQPGMTYWEIVDYLEKAHLRICGATLRDRYANRETKPTIGFGFPTGFNCNHIAAHDSPNPGDKRVL